MTRQSALSTLRTALRQYVHPREFRIAEAPLSPEWNDILGRTAELLRSERSAPGTPVEMTPESAQAELIASVCVGLWRARNNMLHPNTEVPKEGMERALRHVQSVVDMLSTEGIEIKDYTGEPWVDGRAINVVAFQPMQGITADTIIETIKPSVFFHDSHILEGQVIVGTPEGS